MTKQSPGPDIWEAGIWEEEEEERTRAAISLCGTADRADGRVLSCTIHNLRQSSAVMSNGSSVTDGRSVGSLPRVIYHGAIYPAC